MVHRKVLCLGHSHIGALRHAAPELREKFQNIGLSFEVQSLFDDEFMPDTEAVSNSRPNRCGGVRKDFDLPQGAPRFWFGAAGHQHRLTGRAMDALMRLLREKQPDMMVFLCRGNEHSIISMLQHPMPFDFRIPGEDTALIDGAEELPFALIKAQVAHFAASHALLFWDFLNGLGRDVFDGPIHMLPPPPPILSAQHILAHPSSFGSAAAAFGISPSALRAKVWQVYSGVLKDAVQKTNQPFINLPQTIFDDGCLAQKFWSKDPTHGNATYGKVILDHVLSEIHQQALA